jgi:DNA polymerase
MDTEHAEQRPAPTNWALAARLAAAVEAYGADLPLPLAPRPREREQPAGTAPADPGTEPPSPHTGDPAAALAALRARALGCTRCKLAGTRTQVVFGEGAPRARVMFVGEAPGFHEDRQGRPFVGPAGQLLDRIIENAMGLARADVYIANVNKCRPPENRTPQPDEVAACLPFLAEQVQIVRPDVVVALGRVAAAGLLGRDTSVASLRGRQLDYQGIPVVVTWHPAYLLRNPAAKRETWDDIKRVNLLLGRPETGQAAPAPPLERAAGTPSGEGPSDP